MINIQNLVFDKNTGLIPAIIQDADSQLVLMLGYMNKEAIEKTLNEKKVTFYSRSKNRLWTKGETSGNYLILKDIKPDCDNDTLLITAKPMGPTCHTGSPTCFNHFTAKGFIYKLQEIINDRINQSAPHSYTNQLFQKGINKIAQKVGEEAVELIIEAKDDNLELFKNEAADLIYHFLVLLKAKLLTFQDIEEVLQQRFTNNKSGSKKGL